jgi:hypothetical protein
VADHLEARAGIGDHEGQDDGDQDGEDDAEPGSHPEEVPEQHGGVGAHAEEGAVAERDEAEAAHQGPGVAHERPQEDLDDDVPDVLLGGPQGQERDQRHRHQREQPDDAEGARHPRFAKMPPGRTNIRTMKITKAIT